MNNLPRGADLLLVARETLLSELRPLVGEHERYTVAMVANAMAIAAREAEGGDAALRAALARLTKLYGETAPAASGAALCDAIEELERRLALDIRAGRFDQNDSRQHALLEHLRESVIARLRVSNPKSLPDTHLSPEGNRAPSLSPRDRDRG